MDVRINKNAIIITGGPGMGKTSVIDWLRNAGHQVIPESGRDIIQKELKAGGNKLPWADRQGFANKMFTSATADFDKALFNNEVQTFFDRGIPDVIGYLMLCELPVPDKMFIAAKNRRYHQKVFIAPPWEEIYERDEERKQSFDEASATYEVMCRIYTDLGYSLVELPKLTIEKRAAFILNEVTD